MLHPRRLIHLAVLLAIAAAVVAPIVGTGLWNLRVGAEAIRVSDYGQATRAFASAARLLPWRGDLWELAGTAAYAGGDNLQAIRLLEAAKDKGVLTAPGWQALGSSLWSAGRPSAAVATWLAGTEEHPADVGLWDQVAAAYHQQADYEAEQAALERRLRISDDAGAEYRLALLLMFSDADGARAALAAATRLNADVKSAATTLTSALDAASIESDTSRRMVIIGRSLGLVEDWALAGRAFSRAVKADTGNAEARAWLGEARQHLDQNGRPDLDAAMSLGPNSSVVHTLRGLYWRRQGNMGLSIIEYRRAAQLEPQNAALQSLLGEAYVSSGDLVAALAAYQNAVELAPTESRYWRMLAAFCADNGVQVLDLGIAAGMKAVELAPHDAQALDALGWAYAQAGYLLKAEKPLLEALDDQPDFALAHLHLGLTYLRWGQNQPAFDHLSRAAALDANGASGQAASQLLRTYFQQP